MSSSLRLQGLDTWWYAIGVGRVQVFFEGLEMFYFVDDETPQIIAVSLTCEYKLFEFKVK